MIVTENIKISRKNYVKTYSDNNKKIKKVGTEEIYSEAIDVPTANYTYEETEEEVETNE